MPPAALGRSTDQLLFMTALFQLFELFRWQGQSKEWRLLSENPVHPAPCVQSDNENASWSPVAVDDKNLERRIAQAYVWALRAPRTVDGQKVVSLSRHGQFEVRLMEPSELPQSYKTPFWIELFDSGKSLSIDSYGGDDLEEAAGAAQELIAQAKTLDEHTSRAAAPNGQGRQRWCRPAI
jgi:hypothetical protein